LSSAKVPSPVEARGPGEAVLTPNAPPEPAEATVKSSEENDGRKEAATISGDVFSVAGDVISFAGLDTPSVPSLPCTKSASIPAAFGGAWLGWM